MPNNPEEIHQLWQQAEVAELMSVDGFGGFELKANLHQIFSLDPEEDYEVNYHTIAGWRLVVNGILGDYFSCIETLRALDLVLAEENGSILTKKIDAKKIKEILAQQKG